jgi:hypothetical protein
VLPQGRHRGRPSGLRLETACGGNWRDDLRVVRTQTDPTNADSVLRFLAIRRQWGGVRLEGTNGPWDALLGIPPPTPLTNVVIDLGATNATLFYRIRAQRE